MRLMAPVHQPRVVRGDIRVKKPRLFAYFVSNPKVSAKQATQFTAVIRHMNPAAGGKQLGNSLFEHVQPGVTERRLLTVCRCPETTLER